MDLPFEQLTEILRAVFSAGSLLAALLPFWGKLHISKDQSWPLAIFAAAIVFVLWPADFYLCRYMFAYVLATVVLLALFLFGHWADMTIMRQFGHSQKRRDDELEPTLTVLGGPTLASAALELQAQEPQLSTQQIFERLDYDPLRMWERRARTRILVGHWFLGFFKGLFLLLALVSAAAFITLLGETRRSHRALTLEPAVDQIVIEGRVLDIVPTLCECRPDIKWTIEGNSAALASGSLGEITDTGSYSAPLKVDRNLDLLVIATPTQHPHERKKVKIQLRSYPPDYGKQIITEGGDGGGNQASFAIQVIDKRYSWKIGETELNGEDGASLARRMAAKGVFSGFQDIICIGAASREYLARDQEEQRALDRANRLSRWVRDALHPSRARIHALKVGRYDEEVKLTPEQTAPERQVVIVGVLPGADKDVDLLSALRDAFANMRAEEPLLGMYLDKYPASNWELRPIPNARQ